MRSKGNAAEIACNHPNGNRVGNKPATGRNKQSQQDCKGRLANGSNGHKKARNVLLRAFLFTSSSQDVQLGWISSEWHSYRMYCLCTSDHQLHTSHTPL